MESDRRDAKEIVEKYVCVCLNASLFIAGTRSGRFIVI